MDLNKTIAKVGSGIVTVTVFLFALFLIINYSMGSFFVCLILPLGFIMMTAGLYNECENDRKVAANIGLVLSAVYCTFIMLVYFAQLTTVNNEHLTEQAANLLEMGKCGLIFNYDLLGYGIMALSTFMFLKMTSGGDGIGGRLALVAWCVYFLPIGILSFLHYRKR